MEVRQDKSCPELGTAQPQLVFIFEVEFMFEWCPYTVLKLTLALLLGTVLGWSGSGMSALGWSKMYFKVTSGWTFLLKLSMGMVPSCFSPNFFILYVLWWRSGRGATNSRSEIKENYEYLKDIN